MGKNTIAIVYSMYRGLEVIPVLGSQTASRPNCSRKHGGRLPLLFTVTFPAAQRLLATTKLYCLVTEARM